MPNAEHESYYLIGIDPGPKESAAVVMLVPPPLAFLEVGNFVNEELLRALRLGGLPRSGHYAVLSPVKLVIEDIAGHGSPVSSLFIQTVKWLARFEEAWPFGEEDQVELMFCSTVRAHLAGSARAKDGAVHATLWDRFGGDMRAAKGTNKKPGPLHGVSGNHVLDALVLLVAWYERKYGETEWV